eukprot:8692788-Pyramimonas_sp.AAC.1
MVPGFPLGLKGRTHGIALTTSLCHADSYRALHDNAHVHPSLPCQHAHTWSRLRVDEAKYNDPECCAAF